MSWSPIGFGTAQFDDSVLSQGGEALRAALAGGVNWIDTAADFGRGRALDSLKRCLPDDSAGCAIVLKTPVRHSLEPANLYAELEKAQNHLGRERPWFLVLRDPEFLHTLGLDSRAVYERLEKAFHALGELHAKGRIRGFGVSSQGFAQEREAPGFFSLESVWEAAQATLGEDPKMQGFRLIQAPLNLREPGLIALTTCAGSTPADFAVRRGLKLLPYRPLHAWNGTYFTRLADFPHRNLDDSFVQAMRTHLETVTRIESEHSDLAHTGIGYRIRRSSAAGPSPLGWSAFLRWDFKAAWEKLPRPLPPGYEAAVEQLLADYTAWIEDAASNEALEVRARLLEASPDLTASEPLAQLSLRIPLSLPAVTGLACGLTHPVHVEAALAAARAPRLKPAHAIRCFQFVDNSGENTP